jgi:PAS domain S-box-containing protein
MGALAAATGSDTARAVLNALRDGYLIVDADGRIGEVGERLSAMTGYAADDLVGTARPFPFWPTEEHAGGAGVDVIFVHRSGERVPVRVDVVLLEGWGEGGEQATLILARDLRERERLLEAHHVAGLESWDYLPDQDRFEGVGSLSAMVGGPERKYSLAAVANFLDAPSQRLLRARMGALLDGAATEATAELRLEQAPSGLEWVEVRMEAVRDAEGRVLRIRGTSQDVTVRKHAELERERAQERLTQAQRVSALGSFEADYRSGTVTWSKELYRLYGLSPDQGDWQIDAARTLLPTVDGKALEQAAEATIADHEPRQLEHRYLRQGEVRWAETRVEALVEDGDAYGVRGTQQDITDRRRAESRIHLQGRLLDAIGAAVVATDLAGVVTSWNAAAEDFSGWSREEAVGRPVAELDLWPSDAPALSDLTALVTRHGEWSGQVEVRRRDGSSLPAQVRTSVLTDLDGQPAGAVTVGVDVSGQVRAERELRDARDYLLAITDSMAEGVLTLDPEGRMITINRVGERLLGWAQEDLDGSLTWAGVASGAQDAFTHRDGSTVPVDATSTPLETADGVRGTVVVFSDARARRAAEARLHRESQSWQWVQRIRDALAEDRFVLHAQPIVDLETSCTIGNELLIRMVDRDGELIAPGEFLPAAEEHGLIVEIDRWVAARALELAALGHPVELNLSAHSISSPGLVDHFRRELRRTGADPSLVVLELTETALMNDEVAAERFIERIAELGFMLALDDFGTGYGGFSYLKRMKVDFLKIDREFVCDLATNPASRHVVRAVTDLAEGFGQQTVAEGVEDQETLGILRQLGVDFAQGYGIARPRPVQEVLGSTAGVDPDSGRSTSG